MKLPIELQPEEPIIAVFFPLLEPSVKVSHYAYLHRCLLCWNITKQELSLSSLLSIYANFFTPVVPGVNKY